MAFTKITPEELRDKGVIGLPDAPELNTTEMQEKFDEIALDVIVPKFNNLIDELEGAFETTDGAISDESDRAQEAEGELSDAIYALDAEVMKIAVYDTDEDGVVDNAKQLDGHPASYFLSSAVLSDYYTKTETNTALAGKVDKVQGKGLSTNDYSDADKTVVSGVTSALSGKVDKEAGKGLSSNDFTTSYKDQIGTNATNIGNLSNLTTTAKNNLVAAINEAASGGGASDLDDLTDVTISNPADGQVLKYNAASSKWENGAGGGGGASTLSDLTDTAIATPSEGQILQYDSNGKWANTTPSFVGDLDDLSDVTITNPDEGQSLIYNSVMHKWINNPNYVMYRETYADYSSAVGNKEVNTSLAVQALYGNYDELTVISTLSVNEGSGTISKSFTLAGNSYQVGDKYFVFFGSLSKGNKKQIPFTQTDTWYTNTSDEQTGETETGLHTNVVSFTIPADAKTSESFLISLTFEGAVQDTLYLLKGNGLTIEGSAYNTRFFVRSDGTLGYYDRVNDAFKTVGSGNPILPIDPTDATYKSTPGAIWIETV